MEVGSPAFSVAGRLLLLLSALLLAVTPWTEYFWDFDHFLQGGQDLEFGLLSILTVLCLVLVVWWHTKQRLGSIVSVLRLALRFRQKDDPASSDGCVLPSFSLALDTRSPLHTYQPPLLV
jgi:hypothetical protein